MDSLCLLCFSSLSIEDSIFFFCKSLSFLRSQLLLSFGSTRSGRSPQSRRAETDARGLTHPRQAERRQPARYANTCFDAPLTTNPPACRPSRLHDHRRTDHQKPNGGSRLSERSERRRPEGARRQAPANTKTGTGRPAVRS